MICGSRGSKSRLAKAAGAEPAGQRSDEKLHAVVARSTFPSENVQNTPFLDHFWKLRCQKSARRCGAKRVKSVKNWRSRTTFGSCDVEKCTPLWREAHFEVKMYKTPHVRATFGGSDVEKVHAVVVRSTFRSQTNSKTLGFRTIFGGSDVEKKCTLHFTTLHYNYNYNYIPLPSRTLIYTTLNYTTLHYITLHYTTFHYIPLHYTTVHYTTLD